jgi:hypothetical protein
MQIVYLLARRSGMLESALVEALARESFWKSYMWKLISRASPFGKHASPPVESTKYKAHLRYRINQLLLSCTTYMMMAPVLGWLKTYKTEEQWAGHYNLLEKTARKWIWAYTRVIQVLQEEKVSQEIVCNYFLLTIVINYFALLLHI